MFSQLSSLLFVENLSTYSRGFWGLSFSSAETLFSFFSTATTLSEDISLEPVDTNRQQISTPQLHISGPDMHFIVFAHVMSVCYMSEGAEKDWTACKHTVENNPTFSL